MDYTANINPNQSVPALIPLDRPRCIDTTRKMPISDQEFLMDPKSPLKKSYL